MERKKDKKGALITAEWPCRTAKNCEDCKYLLSAGRDMGACEKNGTWLPATHGCYCEYWEER